MMIFKKRKIADYNCMFNLNGLYINDVAACLIYNRNISYFKEYEKGLQDNTYLNIKYLIRLSKKKKRGK